MSGISDRDSHHNPYRAPEAEVPAPIEELSGFLDKETKSEIDERKAYLASEATVRTIGSIHIIMGLLGMVTVGMVFYSPKLAGEIATQAEAANVDPSMLRGVMVGGALFALALNLVIGFGLRRLKNWARWVSIILVALGLLGKVQLLFNPRLLAEALKPGVELVGTVLGTGLSIGELVLLLLPGSGYVCSKHHHFVMAETGEIRPTMGTVAWILLGVYILTAIIGLTSSF